MLVYLYKSLKDNKIRKLKSPKKGAWIFVYELSSEDLKTLEELGFDEDILEDATDYFEVPRFEYFDNILYLFTRYPVEAKSGELSTAPLMIAISNDFLLTVSHKKPEFLDDFVHSRAEFITTQKMKALLLILDKIVHLYDRSLMKIRKKLIRFFGKVENVSESDLKEILSIESKLADYISALVPTFNALTEMIGKKRAVTLHKDDVEILEDLLQDISQSTDTARNIIKTANNIRSAHEVILGHQLNATMKTLTALTIIFTVPTIMTGLFGMNTWLPFSEGPSSFWAVILITTSIALVIAKFFMKKNWL